MYIFDDIVQKGKSIDAQINERNKFLNERKEAYGKFVDRSMKLFETTFKDFYEENKQSFENAEIKVSLLPHTEERYFKSKKLIVEGRDRCARIVLRLESNDTPKFIEGDDVLIDVLYIKYYIDFDNSYIMDSFHINCDLTDFSDWDESLSTVLNKDYIEKIYKAIVAWIWGTKPDCKLKDKELF